MEYISEMSWKERESYLLNHLSSMPTEQRISYTLDTVPVERGEIRLIHVTRNWQSINHHTATACWDNKKLLICHKSNQLLSLLKHEFKMTHTALSKKKTHTASSLKGKYQLPRLHHQDNISSKFPLEHSYSIYQVSVQQTSGCSAKWHVQYTMNMN
jgi:hypothetical protein